LPIYGADIVQNLPQSIDATTALLASEGYMADRALSTLTFLSLTLNRPIFLEGEAGVGKTELAKVIAQGLGRDLIRLQCYEGLDASSSVMNGISPAKCWRCAMGRSRAIYIQKNT